MSAKQCRKCGRFQGVNHSCPTLKSPSLKISQPPKYKNSTISVSAMIPQKISNKIAVSLNSARIEAIIKDSKKLETTIRAVEFSVGQNSQEPTEAQRQMRVKLEATFGNIDWNK